MAWHIVQCTSGKESASCAIMGRKFRLRETWYPYERVDNRPKKKINRSKVSKAPRYVDRAIVHGYLFVHSEERLPCHLINGTHGRLWLRVLSPGGVPYIVPDRQMAAMAKVPDRVKALIEEVEALERSAREAEEAARALVEPIEGMPAKIVQGPFEGVTGTVTAKRRGEVQIDAAVPLWVPETYAERVA